MIRLHRLKGGEFYLNHRLIELVERLPDTTITLTTDHKYIVRETPAEIMRMIQEFESGAPVLDEDTGRIAHPGTPPASS